MFKITVQEVTTKSVPTRTYLAASELRERGLTPKIEDGKETGAYVDMMREVTFENQVYNQTVEVLNLVAVIDAVNKITAPTT